MSKAPTNPRRVVRPDHPLLIPGQAEATGRLVPANIDSKFGTIPSSWKIRIDVNGKAGHYAIVHYSWHFPGIASPDKVEVFGPSAVGAMPEQFEGAYLHDLGYWLSGQLVEFSPLPAELPGGTATELQLRLKEYELLKVATYYAAGKNAGFKWVSETMGIPRQTAALRIQEARDRGFLPHVDHPDVWGFVSEQVKKWTGNNL